jgi:UPF0716 family protein affecting phage T7 exclusion
VVSLGHRLGPRARRAGRRLVVAAMALAVLVAVRAVAGVWVTAGLVAAASLAGLLAGWAALEARAFPRSQRAAAGQLGPRGVRPSDHLAFARALTAVATAYRAYCEGQEQQR